MSVSNGKIRAGVILGGTSSERAVSLRSGHAIYEALKSQNIPVVKIDLRDSLSKALKKYKIRTAFLALHGKGGEDGVIQRELERRKIAYTGSGPQSSYRAFDKALSKTIFKKNNIPTPPGTVVTRKDYRQKLACFSFPVFSKPLADGSSIGVSQVRSLEDFVRNEKKIFGAQRRLLVEEKIIGREITVGIFKGKALPVIELRPKGDFYDYKSKYTAGQTEYLVPAPLKPSVACKAQRIALAAHKALGLRDYSRVDLMLDQEGRPYVLEINTLPGFTSLSLLPKAAGAAGISFEKLCLEILKLAEKRAA